MNETFANFAVGVYSFVLPLSWIGIVICVVVLLPMAVFQGTRRQAGAGLMMASWLFGVTTWTLGAVVTFATYGWVGLLIGLVFFGVGVVPIGIFAAFVTIKSMSLGLSLMVMAGIVWSARIGGAMLMQSEAE